MSEAKIRQLFESAVYDANFGVDIAYENVSYTPKTNKTYIQVTLIPHDTFTNTLKGSEHTAFVGLFQIKIVVSENTGVDETNSLVSKIRETFPTDTLFTDGNFWVQVVSPLNVTSGRSQDGIHTTPCYFEYRADSN